MILIVWFLFCLMSTFGYTYLFCKLAELKLKLNLRIIIIFILGVLLLTFIKYFNLSIINFISYFIFFPILFYFLSKFNLKKLLVYILVIWAIGLLLDLICICFTSIICYVLKISLNTYYNVFQLLLSIFIFLIFIILGNCKCFKIIVRKLIKFIYTIEYSNLVLIIFSSFIFLVGLIIFLNFNSIRIDSLLLIILFLSVFIFILLIKFRINTLENKKFLNTLKENNDFYIKIDDENRIFKHNLMAKLSSIKSVSNKKAISLIDDYVFKTNKNLSYSKKMKSVPYGLNGIIYQKTYPYLENINFKLNNKIGFDIFNVLRPRRYNVLIEKLVLCLDNAIEASLNSKSKLVIINLYDDDNSIYIEIKNSFANTIDVDNLGNLNYSTKGKKRGLGLFSILRDNEASVNIKLVNNYFISTICVRKQK